jgi:ATP-binding cassette, subfamily B, bacterial
VSVETKKTDMKQLWAAAWYAIRLVLRLRPGLFALSLGNELISRTLPFVDAFLAAKIVTALPRLTNPVDREPALRSIFTYLAILLVVRLFDAIQRSLVNLYERQKDMELDALITSRLQEKFSQLPYASYEDKKIIDQYDLAKGYARKISGFVLYQMRELAGTVYTLALAAAAVIHFSWLLAVLLAVFAIPRIALELRVNREQRKIWRKTTVTRRKADTFQDLLDPRSIKDTRLFGMTKYVVHHAFHLGKKAQEEDIAVDRGAEKYRVGLNLLDTTAETGVLAYVVYLIYKGSQPFGQFVFIQQVMGQYSGALGSLVWAIRDMDEFMAGSVEFHTFMQLPEPFAGTKDFTVSDLTFRDVTFTYPAGKRASLQNVSLTIPHGKTVAIVGENGAGKTTLVKLLMKLYVPSSGVVQVGGQDISTLNEHAWHDKLGVLFQDFVSFTDFTIRENVQFGRLSADGSDKHVASALKKAGAYEFALALPNGIDTYMGTYMDEENGTMLSGGQLQRLAIARVLFRDPEILIMDEPTSAVDAKAEYQIFLELEKARRGKTTILISHRFSTVRKADYIFVLDKGRLVEQGTHEELLEIAGHYAELFNAQAEGYR